MRTLRPLFACFLLALSSSAYAITVTGTGDTIALDGSCTLREAIVATNTNAVTADCTGGTGTITFAIGSGAQAINVTADLPPILEPLAIDGTTQPGFAGVPLIEVKGGGGVGPAAALTFLPTADFSSVRGLVINGFSGPAILMQGDSSVIAGNYIGTNQTGTIPVPNGSGITIQAVVTVGGPSAADRNVISGNIGNGISVESIAAAGSVIRNNYIGWNAPKTGGMGNGANGIQFTSVLPASTITSVAENSISRNSANGIYLFQSELIHVEGNEIGSFTGGNSLHGVLIESSSRNLVGSSGTSGFPGNLIVANGNSVATVAAGVRVLSGDQNEIIGNSMHFNINPSLEGMAIDLGPDGVTPNDSCDPDSGANQLQNKPVLLGPAVASGGMTTIQGSLNSTPSTSFTLHFYANAPAAFDQGQTLIGTHTVTTDAACNATFNVSFLYTPPGPGFNVTATATGPSGTSEMTGFVMFGEPLEVTKAFDPATITPGTTSRLTVTITFEQFFSFTATNLAFTDNYPSNVVNAAVPAVSNTCGGTVTATPGGSSLSLSGGSLTSPQTCTVSVDVTATAGGAFTNTIPAGGVTATAFSTSWQNFTPASATLTATVAPTVSKAFANSSPTVLVPTTFTITLTNPNAVALTGVAFTDNYPANLVNATPFSVNNTCGGTIGGVAGGSSVSLTGGTIGANASCSVTVSVVATAPGPITNTLPAGAVTSDNAPPSTAAASATASAAVSAAVPTASQTMLLLLMAAIATAALLRLR